MTGDSADPQRKGKNSQKKIKGQHPFALNSLSIEQMALFFTESRPVGLAAVWFAFSVGNREMGFERHFEIQ